MNACRSLKCVLAAAACALVSFTATAGTWFDAEIPTYDDSWPTDGADKIVSTGTWTNTIDTSYANQRISTWKSFEESLDFKLNTNLHKDVSNETADVVVTIRFPTAFLVPPPMQDSKGAICVRVSENESVTNYLGLVKDPVGGTNTWATLTGAVPDETKDCVVKMSTRVESGAVQVRYEIDGTGLTLNDREWNDVVASDATVTGVSFAGQGEVANLSGLTEDISGDVELAFSDVANVNIVSVKTNDVEITLTDGKYVVAAGSTVTVTFSTTAGRLLSDTSRSYYLISNTTIEPEDMPYSVALSDVIKINEVMASNGDTLGTKNGGAELDWVEIRNDADFAIDLTGWYINDSDNAAKAKEIQGSCVVPARGFKIVWCDKSYTNWAADEAHAALGIDKSGGTIILADAQNAESIRARLTLPPQMKDISYGLGSRENTVLSTLDQAQYRVGSGEWRNVSGPVGMPGATNLFRVISYKLDASTAKTIPTVEAAIASGNYAPVLTNFVETIAYSNASSSVQTSPEFAQHYKHVSTLGPGVITGSYYAFLCEGVVYIPTATNWTFSVGSDDGFSLKIYNEKYSYESEFPGGRTYGQTPAIFRIHEPGAYNVRLVYFQGTSAASLDFSVKEGEFEDYENFTLDGFHLVGLPESGVTHAGAWEGHALNDVSGEMLGVTDTLEWKGTFTLEEDLASDDACKLKVRFADGFTASVNGTVVTNVPAVEQRSLADALVPAVVDVPKRLLVSGPGTTNTVEITAVNDAVNSAEFLLSAEVAIPKADGDLVYFRVATPGTANTTAGYGPATPKVAFSVPHGYKTEAFTLELSCAEAPNEHIYYTLDGTSPTTSSTLYTGPITISSTTCVRAAIPQDGAVIQQDSSATYLFLDDILGQTRGVVPTGFPANKAVNSQVMRYGMDQSIVNGADRDRLLRGFTNSVATLSIVIDPANLFDKDKGIYVNAVACDGRAWERTTMVEQIDPKDASNGFSTAAGIRIRGAFSRSPSYPKHSLRLFFRNDYGDGPLEFPLFGDEGASKFKKVDLRTSQNYAWANGTGSTYKKDTFIHEVFARDTQRDMGDYYTKSRYYNLFINGQYWGLYQTEERGDEDFAETYNGGDADMYDVIKTSQPGYVTGASEGTIDAWEALWNMAVNEGFSGAYSNNYRKAMGQNPDGSRNPEYPVYLNPTNLMDYVINFHYMVDYDSPAASSKANNLYAVRDRDDNDDGLKSQGFYFLRHDAEHTMGKHANSEYSDNPTGYGTTEAHSNFAKLEAFNPAELHYKLCANPEYKMAFADRFYKHCLAQGGALTVPEATKRFQNRMAEIDDVVVCEAARWATDGQTRQTWLSACGGCFTFITNRMPYMLSQYRARGWYPSIDAPVALNGSGATLADGMVVAADDQLYLSGGGAGTVYYTLDGSDPRVEGGEVAGGAIQYSGADPAPIDVPVIAKGDVWKYSDAGAKPADNWTASDYDDSSWSSGASRLGFASSGTFGTTLNRYVGGGSSGTQVTTYYFRKTFTMPAGAGRITELKAALDCDDGYIAYINGVEVKRDQVASTDYSAFSTATNMGEKNDTFTFPAGTLVEGDNVIAVEVHQCNATSTDVWWNLALSYAQAVNVEGGLAVPVEGLTLTMRVLSQSGEWSALSTVNVRGEEVLASQAEAVRVTAVYSSTTGSGDEGEFVVLTNVSANAVLLDGLVVKCAKKGKSLAALFTVGTGVRLEAGASMVFDQSTYWSSGKITNGEVDMQLFDSEGDTIQTLFFSSKWWNGIADGSGTWLVAKEFGTTVTEQAQWKPSESWVEKSLRFFEFDGIPADGNGGDTGEYFVLTNLSDSVTLDLAGVVVNICKSGDPETSSKCIVTIPAMTLAPGATVRFDQATYWSGSKQKITNGALVMKIYDAEGATVQVSTPNQNDAAFANYKAKASSTSGGPVLRATSFARETATADWMEYTPPAPADWPDDPDTEITSTTIAADLAITSGSFTNATPEVLRKLSKWAKANSVPYGGETVNAMSFDANGNPATVLEEAYLLNCAVSEVAAKNALFRFDEIIPGTVPSIDEVDDSGKPLYNGRVRIFGSQTLEGGGAWSEAAEDLATAHFFKAILTF